MNSFKISFKSMPENIAFSRMLISGFLVYLNPPIDVIDDIKTAVSEAVTNAVLHAYIDKKGIIEIECTEENRNIRIKIKDYGVGIRDMDLAKQAFYTDKKDEERAGLGFTIMEAFMDKLEVVSNLNIGTEITMYKKIQSE